MITLLEKGIPWDVIQNFTVDEMSMVMAITIAVQNKRAEAEAKQMG